MPGTLRRRMRRPYLDRLAGGLAKTLARALDADAVAERDGFLQRLDPRTKLIGLVVLLFVALSAKSLAVVLAVLAAAPLLAVLSGVTIGRLAGQAWLPVLAFAGPMALPALVTVPGSPLLPTPVPGWPVTGQGLSSAAFLVARAEAAAGLALLVMLSTPWTHLLKALRLFGLPPVLVVALGMTHRYIFVLLDAAVAMVEARRARTVGRMPAREARRAATACAGTLFEKALALSTDVHLAMISRGYRGEVRLMDDFRLGRRDGAALAVLAALAAAAWWAGR